MEIPKLTKWLGVLASMVAFPIASLCTLILISDAKFSDFFAERISILKDRPSNITKDIVVDATGISYCGGIRTLVGNLIKMMATKCPDWRFIMLVEDHGRRFPELLPLGNVTFIVTKISPNMMTLFIRNFLDFITLKLFHDKITQLCFYNTLCLDRKCDLFFDPYGEFHPNDFEIPKITLIHDLAYLDYPACKTKEVIRYNRAVSGPMIASSRKIITISNFSKQRIMKWYHVPEEKIHVIYPCFAKRLPDIKDVCIIESILRKYNLQKNKYLIYVSSFWPHKNHQRLISAFEKFVASSKNTWGKLAIVGEFNALRHRDFFKNEMISRGLAERVVFTHHVSDVELSVLLKHSRALIFPSLYEGFGMPVAEATAASVPVLCSGIGSLREASGGSAIYFNPYDMGAISCAVAIGMSGRVYSKSAIPPAKPSTGFPSDLH
ncbi:MAG: glycosyltransferase family 4 protein [Holosporaceae bacterium]|jgi:glycosyltransferase involved in cell wall biosynthesis|nr:glycosyltransferase family 4 protein [Holosporaceae bacterium]